MTKKQIMILGAILAVLALGIFLKFWVRSASDNAGSARNERVALVEFDPAKLERILIGCGSQSPAVELANENGDWKVKSLWNAKANPAKVEKFIQGLLASRGELRTSGKSFFADFGIQDADAFSIKLFGAGNTLLQDLRLGTKQAGEDSYFIRKATSENIYLVDMNMAELLGIHTDLHDASPTSLFWADLSLFNLDPEKVTKITVYLLKGDEKTMVAGLERVTDPKDPLKNSWKFLRKNMSSPLDPDKVLKFIVVMNSVRAEKVVDLGGKGYGFEKPVWQLAVTENGKKKLLTVGSKDDKGELFYVKRSGEPAAFALKSSFFDDLNVDDIHFLKDVSPAVKPKKDLPQDINASLLESEGQAS